MSVLYAPLVLFVLIAVLMVVVFGYLTGFEPRPSPRTRQVFGLSVLVAGTLLFAAIGFVGKNGEWLKAIFAPVFMGGFFMLAGRLTK